MARLALMLNAHRPICTGDRIPFAFSLAGGRHTHLRRAWGSPILIQGLWPGPDGSVWQGLRAGKAKANCAGHSPKICLYSYLRRSFC